MGDTACEVAVLSSSGSMESRKKAPTSARPAMQIYRPPGLRSDLPKGGGGGGGNGTGSSSGSNGATVSSYTTTCTTTNSANYPNSPQDKPSSPTGQQQPNRGDENGKGGGRRVEDKEKEKRRREGRRENGACQEVNNNINGHARPSGNRPSPPPSLLSQNIPPPPQYSSKMQSNAHAASVCAQQSLLSHSSPAQSHTSTGCTTATEDDGKTRPPRAPSTLSEDSAKSSSIGSEAASRTTKQKTPPIVKKVEKRRQLNAQEILHAGVALRALSLAHCADELEKLIASEFADEVAGAAVGQALITHAVETAPSSSRAVAKAAQLLKDSACFPGMHRGFILGLTNYYETRENLRQDRFRAWLAVLTLSSDLFGNVGDNEQGELVCLVFDMFCFLLRPPVLDGVKIEELESLISTLLSIGYDLERECPDKLAQLKDLIRDAFIEVSEPWARKMILLMLELSASDWKLPAEANEYYFHHTSN